MQQPIQRLTHLQLALIVAIALVTNFLYLHLSCGNFFFPDSATYLIPARNLLHGLGFVSEPGVAETLRTPGYPLFLLPFVALTSSVLPIIVVQHLLNVILAATAGVVACALTRSRMAGVASGLILAIDTPTIHYANKVLTENLFTAVLFVLLLFFWRVIHTRGGLLLPILSGMICGVLVLIRPVAILYFIVPLAVFAMARIGARRIVAFTIAALLIPLGWGVRNRVETGVFTIASIAGTNMLLYRAAGALAIEDGGEFRNDLAAEQQTLERQADVEIVREEEQPLNELAHAVKAQHYSRIGTHIVLQHPAAYSWLTLRGLLILTFESDWEAAMIVSSVHGSIVELVISGWTAILFPLALIGLAFLWRRDRLAALLLGGTLLYFFAMSAGAESEARFRVPVMPEYAIAVGIGLSAIVQAIRFAPREH
jgi:hypothetical protein